MLHVLHDMLHKAACGLGRFGHLYDKVGAVALWAHFCCLCATRLTATSAWTCVKLYLGRPIVYIFAVRFFVDVT